MKRREFITLLGGAAAAWPLPAQAQQRERMRRIGVLMPFSRRRCGRTGPAPAFAQGLQQLGWTDGGNLRIDMRWSAGDADRIRRYAAELVALAPDVILANGTPAMRALQQVTRTRAHRVRRRRRSGGQASSRAWRGQAATSRVLCRSNSVRAENGWNCSRRSRRSVTRVAVFAIAT